MIAPLRRRHRLTILALSLGLPGLVYLAVQSREPIPRMAATILPGPAPVALESRSALHTEHMLLSPLRVDTDQAWFAAALAPNQAHPRSLLYWHPDAAAEQPFDDGRARFLTALDTRGVRVELPVGTPAGRLLLWDVARGEVRDEVPLSWLLSAEPGEHRNDTTRSHEP